MVKCKGFKDLERQSEIFQVEKNLQFGLGAAKFEADSFCDGWGWLEVVAKFGMMGEYVVDVSRVSIRHESTAI